MRGSVLHVMQEIVPTLKISDCWVIVKFYNDGLVSFNLYKTGPKEKKVQ